MIAEVLAMYSLYSGYFERVMLSVNAVEPTKRSVSSTAPSTVHWSAEPAAIDAEQEERPPLGLLEEEVGVATETPQPGLQEAGLGLSSGIHFTSFEQVEVPLLLVGDRLAGEQGEKQHGDGHIKQAERC